MFSITFKDRRGLSSFELNSGSFRRIRSASHPFPVYDFELEETAALVNFLHHSYQNDLRTFDEIEVVESNKVIKLSQSILTSDLTFYFNNYRNNWAINFQLTKTEI